MEDVTNRIEQILSAVDESRYDEALSAINELPEHWQAKGRMIIARADCHYELGSDVDALRCYLRYLERFPAGRGKNFVLIGISCCLKNLDLQPEAKMFLDQVDDQHEGKQKEIEHSEAVLIRQAGAIAAISEHLAKREESAQAGPRPTER